MKYLIWSIKLFAENVRKNFRTMRLASVGTAQLLYAKIVINLIVLKSTRMARLAKNAKVKLRKRDSSTAEVSLDQIAFMKKYLSGLMSKSSGTTSMAHKIKNPARPIMICHSCAKRKYLQRAERIWVREGRCEFCLDRGYVAQIIEYIQQTDANSH